MDQAGKLRDLVKQQGIVKSSPSLERPAGTENLRILAVTSGKGGVGKSNFSVNLAVQMTRAGKRVVVVDADFGLANVEVLLGVSPKHSFNDVLAGTVSLEDALTTGPEGVRFLSGGSGLTALADVTDAQMAVLITGFLQLADLADIVIIDTGGGMSKTVTNFLKASDETIVITTPDPTSVTDAYAIIKTLFTDNPRPPLLKVVVNRVESQQEGQEVFKRLSRVCHRFLDLKLVNLGTIPQDKHLAKAVKSQEPVTLMYPNAPSSQSIGAIGQRLLQDSPFRESSGIQKFLDRWMGFMRQ